MTVTQVQNLTIQYDSGSGKLRAAAVRRDWMRPMILSEDAASERALAGREALLVCPEGWTERELRLAEEMERRLADIRVALKVAVMGCAVNGPGEAREADLGVAGGDGVGLLFAHGEILRGQIPMDQLADRLSALAHQMAKEKETL